MAAADTAPLPLGKYDVFISHCGVDCKRDFAVWLKLELENVGVRCFFDDHSLRPGDNAPEEMLNAMETATYGIVILSPGFFSRDWCMKELLTFVNRRRVLPIFYSDFNAIEVAKQAAMHAGTWGTFKRFAHSEKEYEQAVGVSYTGLRLSAEDGWWSTCIRKARDQTLQLLGKVCGGERISEDDLVVGQQDKMVELKRLLGLPQQEPSVGVAAGSGEVEGRETPATEATFKEVGIVGVKGMGGVGKSTMAKKLYDDLDVRGWFTGGVCWLEVGRIPAEKTYAGSRSM